MTENEAVEKIKDLSDRGYPTLRKAKEMAISALKEIQLYKDNKLCLVPEDVYSRQCNELYAYKEIGTVEECREAVEKQKTKRIIIRNWSPTRCPTCGHELSTSLGDGYYKHPTFLERCPECGQVISWKESE